MLATYYRIIATHYLLLSTYYLLPATCYLLPYYLIPYCLLPTTCHSPRCRRMLAVRQAHAQTAAAEARALPPATLSRAPVPPPKPSAAPTPPFSVPPSCALSPSWPGGFFSVVTHAVLHRLGSLPRSREALTGACLSLEFAIPSDASGVPLQQEPLRDFELWCSLDWGWFFVGRLPVPYDENANCAFPTIGSASVCRMPSARLDGSALLVEEADSCAEASHFAICLSLRGEKDLLRAINLALAPGPSEHRAGACPR